MNKKYTIGRNTHMGIYSKTWDAEPRFFLSPPPAVRAQQTGSFHCMQRQHQHHQHQHRQRQRHRHRQQAYKWGRRNYRALLSNTKYIERSTSCAYTVDMRYMARLRSLARRRTTTQPWEVFLAAAAPRLWQP